VDVTSSTAAEQTAQVMKVLGEIGAEGTKQILVLSKSDRLSDDEKIEDLQTVTHRILGETARQNATEAVLVSGQRGDGIDRLRQLIDQELKQDPVARQCFRFPLGEGRALNLLHDRAAIVSQKYIEDYCEVVADTPMSIRDRLSEFTVEKCEGA
jgi:GTP-binding protein HflX